MAKSMTVNMERDGYFKWIDRRKEKKFFRKNGMSDPLYLAYLAGQVAAPSDRNPYPPGKRHDLFEAERNADLMGEYMGRNV